MAKAMDLSPSTVGRIWREYGLKAHLVHTFKVSNDPRFAEKLEDVVGLYLAAPEHAIVLCCDEKSQVQALDRTQPGLPMKKGRAGTMTHDYVRHGTMTLFAALNVADGHEAQVKSGMAWVFLRYSHDPQLLAAEKLARDGPRNAGKDIPERPPITRAGADGHWPLAFQSVARQEPESKIQETSHRHKCPPLAPPGLCSPTDQRYYGGLRLLRPPEGPRGTSPLAPVVALRFVSSSWQEISQLILWPLPDMPPALTPPQR